MIISISALIFSNLISFRIPDAMHLGFPLAGGQALIPSMAKAGTAENSWPYALRVPLPTSYGADEGGSGGPLDFDPSDKPPLPILPSASTPTEESESSSSSGTPPTPVTESSLEDER